MSAPDDNGDLNIVPLVDWLYDRFRYDFRGYAVPSLRRRVSVAMARLGCGSAAVLQDRVEGDPQALASLLDALTVQVTDLFRDPAYFLHFRRYFVPTLRTYPFVRIWVAGCSSGEEAYSFAIVLREEGLLDRSIIYATDINGAALASAQAGVYAIERAPAFTDNHAVAGGTSSLSAHYTAGYGRIVMDRALREKIVFSDHSLATDGVFAEVQVVSCRNVLIYFDRTLQRRAVELFRDALPRRGYLGLGTRESLRGDEELGPFELLAPDLRWYRRR